MAHGPFGIAFKATLGVACAVVVIKAGRALVRAAAADDERPSRAKTDKKVKKRKKVVSITKNKKSTKSKKTGRGRAAA